ncbi:hypothetical protein GCM10009641_00130 [Mycobacterium cookii]|uniref:Secreted protein n=2 Tax=Mycobacterium cookii TaxID=1775 RepID=A0A7I7L565_9MYCO|nr:hypothetical protein MCOO_49560 [Mycobacterium cookii]
MSPMSSKSFIVTAAVVAAAVTATTGPAGSPTAAAAPPGFPDVNTFTPVDSKLYTISKPDSTFIGFVTARGVSCTWAYSSDPNAHGPVECNGNIMGIPDSAPDGGSSGCASAKSDAPITKHGGACPPFSSSLATLNGGQKLTAVNVTCVVGVDGLTACIDGDHGLVLQSSGSWTF